MPRADELRALCTRLALAADLEEQVSHSVATLRGAAAVPATPIAASVPATPLTPSASATPEAYPVTPALKALVEKPAPRGTV